MPSAKISFLSAIFKFPYVGWFGFGFCVVGDEKQKRDIQIQFRSYRPNRRDESRYASKTDIIILHLSKKSKPLFDIFLKKSHFFLIMNEKKLQKSSLFWAFPPHFPPKLASIAAETHVFPCTNTGRSDAKRRMLRHLSICVHFKLNLRSNRTGRERRRFRTRRPKSPETDRPDAVPFRNTPPAKFKSGSVQVQFKFTFRTPGSCRA